MTTNTIYLKRSNKLNEQINEFETMVQMLEIDTTEKTKISNQLKALIVSLESEQFKKGLMLGLNILESERVEVMN